MAELSLLQQKSNTYKAKIFTLFPFRKCLPTPGLRISTGTGLRPNIWVLSKHLENSVCYNSLQGIQTGGAMSMGPPLSQKQEYEVSSYWLPRANYSQLFLYISNSRGSHWSVYTVEIGKCLPIRAGTCAFIHSFKFQVAYFKKFTSIALLKILKSRIHCQYFEII